MEERKKQTQKTEKPCEVIRTEQEALDGSSPRKKPSTWKSKEPHVKGYEERAPCKRI